MKLLILWQIVIVLIHWQQDIVLSNSVCNYTSDYTNRTPASRSSDFFYSLVWLPTELDSTQSFIIIIKFKEAYGVLT